MSYTVAYINCKVCGGDDPKFLGTRGNLEYFRAPKLNSGQEHMVTNIVKCRRCGFVYTNPLIIILPEIKAHFYDQPDEYHPSAYEEEPLNLFNRSLNIIEKFVKGKGRLLDVGSGKGEFLAAAEKRGWRVFGVEPAQTLAQYSKQKYGLDIQSCTLEKANFPENFFDAVTLNMVLEHIDNPHSLLSTIYRILKRGGVLYVEVPNMDSMLVKLIKICFKFTKRDWSPHISPLHYPYHCYGYGRSSLKLLCEMNKLIIKRFFIFGIGLRGFRRCADSKFMEKMRNILAKFFGLVNQGDILIAVAAKK